MKAERAREEVSVFPLSSSRIREGGASKLRTIVSSAALVTATALWLVFLAGCGEVGQETSRADAPKVSDSSAAHSSSSNAASSSNPPSSEGATTVGAAFAQADLEPVGNFGTGGTALFKEVGSLGVQVDLEVSGLPKEDPRATYYAQVHEGTCSDKRTGEGREQKDYGDGTGPAVALVNFNRLLAKAQEYAHGGHEHSLPEVPPGSIEQPVPILASDDGSASVSSLLEGLEKKGVISGAPKYMDLHSAESEDTPVLACGDLKTRGQR